MTQSVKQLTADLFAAWNAHDPERMVALYAPDYEEVDVAQAATQVGRDGVRRTMTGYLRAFPDLQLALDDLVVEDNRVAVAWTLRGTHRGALMNIPPSGRMVSVRGTSILTVEEGRFRRALRIWDVAGLLRAIGLLPEL
jgi:steroid delta-isomerase-like uncharacterized protein